MFKVTSFSKTSGLIKSLSCAALLVSLSVVAATPAPTPTPGQAAPAGATPAPTVSIPEAPALAATGYILIDGETGEVLAQNNADQRLPPASLTKMMSSYLVIDELIRGRINETNMVNISVKAWKMEGSRMYVKEGTQVSVIDLLRGEIIQSGNDATVALAEYVGGNEDAFVDLMNKKALELGMKSTHYQNAAGLPAPEHYTTARDLAVLARAVIYNHPQHYPLYAEKEFKYNNIRQPNRNKLLYLDPTVDGLKTGHTEEAGYCLVASSKREGTRLIAVVLGTKSDNARAEETQKLLAYGFRYFETVSLYKANTEITKARVWSGKAPEVVLGLPKDVRMTLPRGHLDNVKANVHVNETINAPILAGQELGSLTIELDGKVINTQPLVALQPVEEASFFARMWDKIKLFFRGLFS
ncbi:D-Ala-D-Ala carboxypeptidase [Cellvibrio zantedeschiae]|uniref:serine-type D-Ala-D-Ala carboxypeptidase n=1 Tax=Cellvibrio zantedeschiae TaxID=1237077 RepID=A0ABQ3ARG7_9GAMM|nr:D-alanyl-D-alanine carboxypeptidase family protein [Cellvibrio zantedeschiae]GGY61751.1 D-Ala-D-Ala carboxypeptidase [Cellvibrio zantedeschiae]